MTVFPMLACHLAMLHARRSLLGVMAFTLLLMGIAAHYAGGFDSAAACISTGWIGLLIVSYGLLYLLFADNSGRDAYFKALGRYRAWCWAQAAAHCLAIFPAIIVWVCILYGYMGISGIEIIGIQLLFEAVFSQATFVSLQPRFAGLSNAKRFALMGVISGPWILTAWMLGIFASYAILYDQNAVFFILGLMLLGAVQTGMGCALNE